MSSKYQELFNLLSDEHELTLLESEMEEIITVVDKINKRDLLEMGEVPNSMNRVEDPEPLVCGQDERLVSLREFIQNKLEFCEKKYDETKKVEDHDSASYWNAQYAAFQKVLTKINKLSVYVGQ